ncbi:MAG: carbohydrate ABC transporter substrate-binding protein [Anaerolineae bacterium]|nr:carbohydrate ABC transporter substrate-binding protein [Anaerolineae bacterium]
MSKNKVLKYSLLLVVVMMLVSSLSVSLAQDDKTLTVYLNQYYDPAQNPDTAKLSQDIAQKYMDAHPGVTIKLVENLPASQDAEAFLAARMAADQSPDIMWQQFGTRNVRGKTWWVPLNDYLDKPNPYIAEGTPGHDKWSDSLPDYVLAQTRAADGNWYQVSLDWVETGLYYNKDLFKQAGIDPKNWTSWGKFIGDLKTLKEKTGADGLGAYVKQGDWSNWFWADDLFLTVTWSDIAKDIYMEKYNDANRPWRQLNPEEVAKAILDGKLNATDPRMENYLKLSKDFVSVLPADYNGIASLDDLDKVFFSGQLGAYWTGTWKNKTIADAAPFEYGVTYIPGFTKEDAPGAQGTAYRVGGPSSAGQYGIAQSAAKNGKLDLAVDFLQYISAPQNFGPMATSLGGFLPLVKGTDAGPVMSGFEDVAKLPERMFNDPDNRLDLAARDPWINAMQAFFLGQTDDATTLTALQGIWMDGAKRLCADQKYDWCPAS